MAWAYSQERFIWNVQDIRQRSAAAPNFLWYQHSPEWPLLSHMPVDRCRINDCERDREDFVVKDKGWVIA